MIPSHVDHIMDLFYVGAFLVGGLALAIIPILISHLIAPAKTRNYVHKTGQAIECGMDPIGDAWIRFGVVYYLYALIIILNRLSVFAALCLISSLASYILVKSAMLSSSKTSSNSSSNSSRWSSATG